MERSRSELGCFLRKPPHKEKYHVKKCHSQELVGTHIAEMCYYYYYYYYYYDLEEISINTGNWVDSAQDRDYWKALVNAALNLRVP